MNPRKKNLLSFLGAIALGVLMDYTLGGALGSIANLGIISLIAGFALLVFGSPHKNPKAGLIGWGALGLTVGIFAPVLLIFAYMANC